MTDTGSLGGLYTSSRHVPLQHVFVAQSSRVVVSLQGDDLSFVDKNPVLSALTLEADRRNYGELKLFPNPLIDRVLVDVHRNQGQVRVISL